MNHQFWFPPFTLNHRFPWSWCHQPGCCKNTGDCLSQRRRFDCKSVKAFSDQKRWSRPTFLCNAMVSMFFQTSESESLLSWTHCTMISIVKSEIGWNCLQLYFKFIKTKDILCANKLSSLNLCALQISWWNSETNQFLSEDAGQPLSQVRASFLLSDQDNLRMRRQLLSRTSLIHWVAPCWACSLILGGAIHKLVRLFVCSAGFYVGPLALQCWMSRNAPL